MWKLLINIIIYSADNICPQLQEQQNPTTYCILGFLLLIFALKPFLSFGCKGCFLNFKDMHAKLVLLYVAVTAV